MKVKEIKCGRLEMRFNSSSEVIWNKFVWINFNENEKKWIERPRVTQDESWCELWGFEGRRRAKGMMNLGHVEKGIEVKAFPLTVITLTESISPKINSIVQRHKSLILWPVLLLCNQAPKTFNSSQIIKFNKHFNADNVLQSGQFCRYPGTVCSVRDHISISVSLCACFDISFAFHPTRDRWDSIK
jgi:hypothetical protein